MPPCETTVLRADRLAAEGPPGCDPAGASLRFPDGTTVTIPAVGAVVAQQDSATGWREHLVVNWGSAGVGASLSDGDVVLDLWASGDEAMRLHREQLALAVPDGMRP